MYRHLLVPLDDSPLAVDTVHQAVTFAKTLGAKVTFFHAQADYGASSIGALERVMSPATFNDHMAGEARAILAKAEVVARVAGVPHDSAIMTSDRPHEAILHAAEARGCDLIFIASHGRRGIKGLMLGSQTQKVLQLTTIPVLVSAVESNLPYAEMLAPLTTIRDEHRSIAAVIHGLEFVARQARDQGTPPSFPLLRAMLHYLVAFPEKLHHPKEDAYLFRKLRERTSEFDATLDELERQHVDGHQLVEELARSIDAYEANPLGGLTGFSEAVDRFSTSQIQHMALEAKVIIPAARVHLTREDWAEIGAAFAANGDPRFSVDNDEEFRELFVRIVNLAQAPVASAPAHGLKQHAIQQLTWETQDHAAPIDSSHVRRSTSTTGDRARHSGVVRRVRRRPGVRHRHRQSGHPDALGQHAALQPRRPDPVAGQQDHRQPELRRRRPQFRQGLARRQPVRRAVRVRLRLQAANGLSRERRRLVRQRV